VPQPPPQPSKRVDFSGTITGVSGGCPNVTFTVQGLTIVTDRSTDFTKSKCDDLRRGRDDRVAQHLRRGIACRAKQEAALQADIADAPGVIVAK